MDSCFIIDTLEDSTEEATPIILAQDLLEACLAHFNMDSFDIDGYMEKVNVLLEPPIFTPPWIQKYEPMPSFLNIPIESPPTIKQEPLLVMTNDPSREHDEISDQKTQLVGAQNKYKEAMEEIATMDCPLQLPSYKPNHAVLNEDPSRKFLNCIGIDDMEELSELLDPPWLPWYEFFPEMLDAQLAPALELISILQPEPHHTTNNLEICYIGMKFHENLVQNFTDWTSSNHPPWPVKLQILVDKLLKIF